jgi:hypothetical protein
MTEAEWLACTDPTPMLGFLRGKASERKLGLFAVACCRRIWHLLVPGSLKAVEVAERYADGLATEEELSVEGDADYILVRLTDIANVDDGLEAKSTREQLEQYRAILRSSGINANAASHAADAALAAVEAANSVIGCYYPSSYHSAAQAMSQAQPVSWDEAKAIEHAEGIIQTGFLRDIIGNPFRPATVDASWLMWKERTIVNLARGIYEERAFDNLPILADALEEAGCTNLEIVNHLREPGPHVRGCWVVDLLLTGNIDAVA